MSLASGSATIKPGHGLGSKASCVKLAYLSHILLSNIRQNLFRDSVCLGLFPRSRWLAWKPVETACYEGFGMVDASGSFVSDRANAVGCGLCQAGTASEELTDDVGRTFICKQCPPGYSQANTYSTRCEPCPKGTSASVPGSTECTPCGVGKYQPDTAQTSCLACDEFRTTLLLGASSLTNCVCESGKIEQLSTCVSCPEESMHCPTGSTLAQLQAVAEPRDATSPYVIKGYFSDPFLLKQVLMSLFLVIFVSLKSGQSLEKNLGYLIYVRLSVYIHVNSNVEMFSVCLCTHWFVFAD